MTNYEWLVESKQLKQFIFDISFPDLSDRKNTDRIYDRYGLELCWGESISERIAEWLKSQRKTTKKYVALDDVIKIIAKTRTSAVAITNRKEDEPIILELSSQYQCHLEDMLRELRDLEVKEIDE